MGVRELVGDANGVPASEKVKKHCSMVLTALGLGLGWVSSCYSSCTVSNVKMPYTVMVPTIALYHSGVGAVVSPVSFFILLSFVWFWFFLFLPYLSLIGCCDHAY